MTYAGAVSYKQACSVTLMPESFMSCRAVLKLLILSPTLLPKAMTISCSWELALSDDSANERCLENFVCALVNELTSCLGYSTAKMGKT